MPSVASVPSLRSAMMGIGVELDILRDIASVVLLRGCVMRGLDRRALREDLLSKAWGRHDRGEDWQTLAVDKS